VCSSCRLALMESDAHTRLGLGTGGVKWPCPRYLVDVSFMRSSGMLDYELCLKCIECDLDVAREANCTLTFAHSSHLSAYHSYSQRMRAICTNIFPVHTDCKILFLCTSIQKFSNQ